MPDLIQSATWPGFVAVEEARYECSHGVSPGRFLVSGPVQATPPMPYGNLVFTDGYRTISIRDCKLDTIGGTVASNGQTITMMGQDRRWKWQDKGQVTGRYNQVDERGKLIPWSIRSPTALVQICLNELGESNATILMPQGLGRAAGANLSRYLQLGENFPQSFTNPPVVWDYTPAAQALASLCDYYGLRVIYSPITDRVAIAAPGTGRALPNFPYEIHAPQINRPPTPKAWGVAGAHIKFQMRLLLEPVAKEWNDSYVPINLVSYAPIAGGRVQIAKITNPSGSPGTQLCVTIAFIDPKTGAQVSHTFNDTNPGNSTNQRLLNLVNEFSTYKDITDNITLARTATDATFTGRVNGFSFSLDSSQNLDGSVSQFVTNVVQAPQSPGACWAYCPPPSFASVQPTDRLSYIEAKGLAQESVWKTYRITNFDPGSYPLLKPLQVPFFGPLRRRQQLVISGLKAEMVVPKARIAGVVNKENPLGIAPGGPIPFQGVIPEFYNGYNRQQRATVTGSVFRFSGGTQVLWYPASDAPPGPDWNNNTGPTDRVFVNFSVDPLEQLVTFSDHVYYFGLQSGGAGQILAPTLVLECSCLVKDPDNDQPVRWEETLSGGGVALPEWQIREDVAVSVIGRYSEGSKLIGFDFLDLADARGRAGYYLRGMAAPYRITSGATRQYVGIYPIQPDGYIQQVTWSVGGNGATTTASGNTEHSIAVPSYPTRRLRENMPPNSVARLANLAEKTIVDQWHPKVE